MHIKDIQSLPDVVFYWKEQLEKGEKQETAYNIVGVVSHPNWESWYQADSADSDFFAVFGLAAQLETAKGTDETRKKEWAELKDYMKILEERYLA